MSMLHGRVAIVTGGGRGLGRSHCLELAAHGARVVVNDLGVGLGGEAGDGAERSPAEEVVAEIVRAGGEAVADGSDVTDWAAVGDLVAATVQRWGRLDCVVNNAGIVRDRMIVSLSEQDWDAVIAVHLKGTFTLTKHACDHWRAESKAGRPVSGRIVNTTSGSGLFGNPGQSPYAAAKAGIAALTMVTGMEMGRYGVTCNAISPLALTRMTGGSVMAGRQAAQGWDPMDPDNASPVVAYLAAEASGWLTGQVLRIDGNTVSRVNTWEIDRQASFRSMSGERLDAGEIDLALRRAYRVTPRGLGG